MFIVIIIIIIIIIIITGTNTAHLSMLHWQFEMRENGRKSKSTK